MTREDMAATLRKAYAPLVTADKLRDSHHRVARLAAAGLRNFEICARTGYSAQRVGQLLQAPAMQELVARYRAKVDAAFEREQDAFYSLATHNMIKAERMLADKLEEADGETIAMSVKDLALVSRDGADRFGYGKHSTQRNENVDFAALLEQAIQRSGKSAEVAKAISNVVELAPARRRV